MDIIDDIFGTLDVRGTLYFRTEFSGDWGTTVPSYERAARFHLVVQGQCIVTFDSGDFVVLQPGDLLLIPHGARHILSSDRSISAPPLETVLEDVSYDGQGVLVVGRENAEATTQMICGHFSFRPWADHQLLSALPEHILATASTRAQNPWLDDTLKLISQHVFSEKLGAQTTVTKLSEIVFIELLRSGINTGEPYQKMLRALADRQVGAALQAMHRSPETMWTVGSLAREVGMSRSRFAERFNDLVGVGPMSYLQEWRLQKALALLDDTNCAVQEVAARTAYRSAAAFTRAFSLKFGLTPSAYRNREVES